MHGLSTIKALNEAHARKERARKERELYDLFFPNGRPPVTHDGSIRCVVRNGKIHLV